MFSPKPTIGCRIKCFLQNPFSGGYASRKSVHGHPFQEASPPEKHAWKKKKISRGMLKASPLIGVTVRGEAPRRRERPIVIS